ncbi:TonB-dependent receptor [Pseudoalteromonas spongiae]|uniref:TonB-dependent receptor n=1 Tax=Pseudoalteromonas spongiae TaxID=298657 RepID=UPI000C2D1522|nr:TonB-dependent receptor [Pseudoalteromonas spongiae]
MKILPLALAISAASLSTIYSPVVLGNTQSVNQLVQFDINASSLHQGLAEYTRVTGIQLFVNDALLNEQQNAPVKGQFTAAQGLTYLLNQSNLYAEWKSPQGVVLKAKAPQNQRSQTTNKPSTNAPLDNIEVVQVNGSRMQQGLTSVARQTSYFSAADISNAMAANANLAQVIGKLVPGVSPASQTMTNFGLTLRGRNLLVLIDGVPMSTNRNVSRDLFNLDPSLIYSIEIVRGGNAIYGSGASGGVMYITTKTAKQSSTQTRAELSTSLTEISSDAATYKLGQSIADQRDKLSFAVDFDIASTGGYFDANGDRIAPEPSQGDLFDSTQFSLHGKVGYQFDKNAELFASVMWFDSSQDTEFASDPSVNSLPLHSVSAKPRKGLVLAEQNSADNLMFNLHYVDNDLWSQQFSGQLYYRDYETRFYPFDGRPFASWNHLGQVYLNAQVLGFRSAFSLPISNHTVIYGLDGNFESTKMPITAYDPEVFDNSNGLEFVKLEDKTFMPETDTNNIAAFAQYKYHTDWGLNVDAGARFEHIRVSFDDFTTLGQGNSVDGGSKSYDGTMLNASVNYSLTDNVKTYIAFDQGYELPDIGLLLRYASSDFDIKSSELEPVTSDNFEIGFNYQSDNVSVNGALFNSTSDRGRVKSSGFGLDLRRDKERISGIELDVNYYLTDALSMMALVSKINGDEKPEGADTWREMNGFRIAPLKATFATQYQFDNINLQAQLNYVDGHDYRLNGNTGFGRHQTDSYITLDLFASIELDQSVVNIGIENATNREYYPLYSQLLRSNANTSHIPAKGAMVKLTYRYNW